MVTCHLGEKFYSAGTLSPENWLMTIILLQIYFHIDTGKRFNAEKDRKDPLVVATRSKRNHLGVLDSAQIISMLSTGTKHVPSNQGLSRFSNSGHTLILRMFSWSQFLAFVMHYIKVRSHFHSSFYNEKIILVKVVINSGITTNLRNKGLSVSQVEDWKISIPSFDLFPTIPLTFDEVYWEAYWQIVNKPASVVREVMIKLEKET